MLLAPQRVSGHLCVSALRGPNVGMFTESLCNFISITVSRLRLYCSLFDLIGPRISLCVYYILAEWWFRVESSREHKETHQSDVCVHLFEEAPADEAIAPASSIFHIKSCFLWVVFTFILTFCVKWVLSRSQCVSAVKMEELQTIKRELTMIKVQIDGLLDSLDRMDRQRQELTGQSFPETRQNSLNRFSSSDLLTRLQENKKKKKQTWIGCEVKWWCCANAAP